MMWLTQHIKQLSGRPLTTGTRYIDLYCMIQLYKKNLIISRRDIVPMDANWTVKNVAMFLAIMETGCVAAPGCTFEDIRNYKTKQTGVLLLTSGSTGQRKALILDRDKLIDTKKDRRIRDDRILLMLKFDHIGGINTLLHALSVGAEIVMPQSTQADHLMTLIESRKVTVLPTSPTQLNFMLMSDWMNYDLSSVKTVTYGTEPMPYGLYLKIQDMFPRATFVQTYGTSETGIIRTESRDTWLRIKDRNCQYKIVDNELYLKTHAMTQGYLNADNDRFVDGWFKTGDLVETDKDWFRIIGRRSKVINMGGLKVHPSEVESALMEVCQDCKVYGLNNGITGQIVAADVVTDKDKYELRSYLKSRLKLYQIPMKFNFVKSIANTGVKKC